MYQLLGLLITFASPLTLIRRLQTALCPDRKNSPPALIPRAWTIRPRPLPYQLTTPALEHDMWPYARESLGDDVWYDHRDSLNMVLVKHAPWGNPKRRQYLTEELDGRESLNWQEECILGRGEGVRRNVCGPESVGRVKQSRNVVGRRYVKRSRWSWW